MAERTPRATYRLQLNKNFTFSDAEAIAPYLGRLGVSHAYLSPILKARPGSMHGYDTVDHTTLNPELGTLADFRRLASALRAEGIGIVLDIVPNHMGVGGSDNALWLDVLEWGQQSRYADWFDIDWSPREPSLHGRLLVPFLGTSFGEALEQGDLQLRFDTEAGRLAVWAYDSHKLPLAPASYAVVLDGVPDLAGLAADLAAATDGPEGAEELLAKLQAQAREKAIAAAIDQRGAALNEEPGRETLARLIDQQHWRVARFSVASDEINYRRFFIVSDLAGIRIERDEVFAHAHRLVFELIAEGLVDGLRIDHIDGLYDPAAYCEKLRQAAPRPIYLVVEKILAPHEQLRADWGVDGTTGYEFATVATRLLLAPEGRKAMSRTWHDFTGDETPFDAVEREAKLEMMDYELAAERDALVGRLQVLAAGSRATSDFTGNALCNGLRQIVANMAVYRSYITENAADLRDRRMVGLAVARSKRLAPQLDPALLGFIGQAMCGDGPEALRPLAVVFARRMQQFTGPVMAKGLEDTALYRANRLLALNDVGSPPDREETSIAAFHDFNRRRAATVPHGMLTTSSHDTKRGEDTRARIAVLPGMAEAWHEAVFKWRELLGEHVQGIDSRELYAFFQLLLGAWPVDGERADFGERLEGAVLKAARESRLHTSWAVPRADYEDRLRRLVAAALKEGPFLEAFQAFEQKIAAAGAANGLVLTLLKLTAPGVPDIYQGAELWEQSMVDPDNRRPVDFAQRERLLAALTPETDLASLWQDWRNGAVKQALIQRLLAMRAERPELFAAGDYRPVAVTGAEAERVIAFIREAAGSRLLVVAALQPSRPVEAARLELEAGADWLDLLRPGETQGDPMDAAALLSGLPVAALLNAG